MRYHTAFPMFPQGPEPSQGSLVAPTVLRASTYGGGGGKATAGEMTAAARKSSFEGRGAVTETLTCPPCANTPPTWMRYVVPFDTGKVTFARGSPVFSTSQAT